MQKTLHAAPRGTLGEEARRDDVGVVAEEGKTTADEVGQIGEDVVRNRAPGAVDDEQPRLVAARGGCLRDQLGRQGVVEERGFQREARMAPRGRGGVKVGEESTGERRRVGAAPRSTSALAVRRGVFARFTGGDQVQRMGLGGAFVAQ